MLVRVVALIAAAMLAGCVMGIPDAVPPPKPTPACQIWVRIDNGPWRCYERGKVLRDLCKATACSP